MHHGVSEFLTKPINKHELFARVRAQLHILELARQLETVERNLHAARRNPAPDRPTRQLGARPAAERGTARSVVETM